MQEAEELPVSMGNTLKEMQAFAAAHPELGEIQGKTKAVFLANLTEVPQRRVSDLSRLAFRTQVRSI